LAVIIKLSIEISETSYNSGNMAHEFLPDDRKSLDYEESTITK